MVKSNILRVDPSLLPSMPTTSRDIAASQFQSSVYEPPKKRCIEYFYNREKKEYCGRTCKSWLKIIAYSIMYLILLSTYTLILLFISLLIIKARVDFESIDKTELLTYPERGIGLTASPTSDLGYPVISYRKGVKEDYEKYIKTLDKLLLAHRRRNIDLGPCGQTPYGYGDNPCVIIRVNKQYSWAGKPLALSSINTTSVPSEVQKHMYKEEKLWLQCKGYHSYDEEHIGKIKYYPDPPGFDPNVFPLDKEGKSPLVAVQISNFTIGISLAIKCQLWYEKGPSTIEFMLYVAPEERIVFNKSSVNI